jgi:3'-phosphoadenosine 5'-phosphosulfate sulfotransferase (PAPS reductase)/FAD synthetase
MMLMPRANFHHSKLPEPGALGHIVGLSTIGPQRKCIVSHYPLCDKRSALQPGHPYRFRPFSRQPRDHADQRDLVSGGTAMTYQLPLFPVDAPDPPDDTPDALTLLRDSAALVLSVSGGKDSDAMTHHLLDLRQSEGWTGDVMMVHADLGSRVEWHQTPGYVCDLAQRKGVPLHVVRWQHGDLIDRIWQRYHKDPSRPCWPSSQMRYCTSDLKRGPISRWLRNTFPSGNVVCSMGLRAEESSARAKRQTFRLRKDSSAPTKGRFVYDWLPIHDWTEADVWNCIRQHGDIAHPAYRLGAT